MNTQLAEVRDEMVRMQKDFQAILERPRIAAEEKTRMWTKLGLLDELLRFVDSRPETEMPKSVICKKTLVKYLEDTIIQQRLVVTIFMQGKCFEGGKLAALEEILQDIKRM